MLLLQLSNKKMKKNVVNIYKGYELKLLELSKLSNSKNI